MSNSPVENYLYYRIKWFALLALCAQNSGHALLSRYSQGILKEKYSSTEVVLIGEFMKLIFSSIMIIHQDKNVNKGCIKDVLSKFIWLVTNSKQIIILVISYSTMNILVYYALARIDAATYVVCLQLKAFSTAAFSILLLHKSVSHTKWRAIVQLVIGCILVASPSFNHSCSTKDTSNRLSESTAIDTTRVAMGIACMVCTNMLAGFCSVYFEGILKKSDVLVITIWERNFQLAVYSIAFLLLLLAYEHMSAPYSAVTTVDHEQRLFQGWTTTTVAITVIQAAGGLLVACTLKYADSMLKTLVSGGSIVIAAILGHVLLNGPLDMFVVLGSLSVILAIFNYTLDSSGS